MAYEELDSWVDANAPNLNKNVLHTQVASIVDSEGGGSSDQFAFFTVYRGNTPMTNNEWTFDDLLNAHNQGKKIMFIVDTDGATRGMCYASPNAYTNGRGEITGFYGWFLYGEPDNEYEFSFLHLVEIKVTKFEGNIKYEAIDCSYLPPQQ